MTARRGWEQAEHVALAGNVMLCNACGSRQELNLPQSVDSVAALLKAWNNAHAKCKGNTSAFRDARGLETWAVSDDTGLSSLAIYRHMRGLPPDAQWGVRFPWDPSDFGRCYRLLQLAPEWRARIGEMAKYGVEWSALSAAWDELTALYEEEAGPTHTGRAPKLYARMKELTDKPAKVPA